VVTVTCNVYFQDNKNEWHQPGTTCELSNEEAQYFAGLGFVKIIETTMAELPENRIINHRRRRK
jgi:hypothetical protein